VGSNRWRLVVLGLAVLVLGGVAGSTSALATAPTRAFGIPGSAAAGIAGAGNLGAAPSGASVTTQVYLAGRASALAAYASSVSDPGSPDYQHFLSPAQVQARFGATTQQVGAVKQWLEGAGLRVAQVSPHEITTSGTVADTDDAYDTRLDRYSDAAGTFTAPSLGASVPASLGGAVLSIGGLDSQPMFMHPGGLATEAGPVLAHGGHAQLPLSKGQDGAPFLGPTPCSAYYGQLTDTTDPEINGAHQPYATCGYVPSQMRGAYGVTGGTDGQGVTVAVVDAYGHSTIESDANTYATNQGDAAFASGQFTDTETPADWVDESECGGPGGWAGEESLDVEAVHAMAPGADVHYFGANSCEDSDFLATLGSIIDNHSADVITDSWGEVIYSSTGNESSTVIAEYTQLFEQAAIEGIEVTFSAGDCGDEDPTTSCGTSDTSNIPQADFPDSDPWVTALGGTSVEIGEQNQVAGVVPWGDDVWYLSSGSWDSEGWYYGGGGGTSAEFTQPSYQQGVVPTALAETLPGGTTLSQPMRVVPDIAMDADPLTGFLVGETQTLPGGGTGYAESDWGGTSLASPLFAGLVADGISHGELPRGFLNPTLYGVYSSGSSLYDDVVSPTTTDAPYDIYPAYDGGSAAAVELGDDQALKATLGYDDATGLGMPSPDFLTLGATTTAITSSSNPSTLGQPVTFTAKVTQGSGPVTPTGQVQFYVDGSTLGSPVALSAGSATSPADSGLTAGAHTITAGYSGDTTAGFTASTSPGLSQEVNQVQTQGVQALSVPTKLTSLSVTQVGSSLSVGQVSATLMGADTDLPVGGETVVFTSGSTHLCSVTTSTSGVASCQFSLTGAIKSLLSAGYRATFAGSGIYQSSTAAGALAANYSAADPFSTTLGTTNNTVSITLTCLSNGGSCNTAVDLYATAGALPVTATASGATLLGAGRFTIPRGTTRTEDIRLNAAGRKLAKGKTRFTARLMVTSRTGSGPDETNTDTVKVEQVKASLLNAITPHGTGARIASLLGQKGYSLSFTALYAGKVTIDWYYLPAVHGKGTKPELVADGNATFSYARTLKLAIRLTAPGARLLGHGGRLKLTAKAKFTTPAEPAVAATKGFSLG
jgi:Pro-kumamolisin, activation domain/Bacterial Ig-like domain (group 3)